MKIKLQRLISPNNPYGDGVDYHRRAPKQINQGQHKFYVRRKGQYGSLHKFYVAKTVLPPEWHDITEFEWWRCYDPSSIPPNPSQVDDCQDNTSEYDNGWAAYTSHKVWHFFPTGTWSKDFRPTKIRITMEDWGKRWQIYTESGINKEFFVTSTPFEEDLNIDSDIKRITMHDVFSDYYNSIYSYVEKIEFFGSM